MVRRDSPLALQASCTHLDSCRQPVTRVSLQDLCGMPAWPPCVQVLLVLLRASIQQGSLRSVASVWC